jgi:imidazolonepropionase
MSIAETIVAATINAACAAGVQKKVGSIQVGKLIVCEPSDYRDLAYYFGSSPVRAVPKKGRQVNG